MAVDFYLNPSTGDIDLTNGIVRLTRSKEEVSRQQIEISLSTFRGEWIYNINAGIPWLQNRNNPIQLLGKNTSPELIESLVRQDIFQREFVEEILNLNLDFDIEQRTVVISRLEVRVESGEVVTVTDIPLGSI